MITSGKAYVQRDLAVGLAEFACKVDISTLNADVVLAAKTNLFDTLVCAAAGSAAHSASVARELAMEWGGTPQATIFGTAIKVPAHHAAWVNGTMSHARDYDDTHDAAVLHAGVSVIPAAIAAAELYGTTTGASLIAGVAAGLETICRLGVATRISIVDSGWIYTPLFGFFAATVAAGRIAKLTPQEMVNALGITYSQVAGNHQVTRDGAHTKSMQPGFAAQAALTSVQLTRKGIRGAQNSFDGEDGFLRVYLRDQFDHQSACDQLGKRFELVNLSYKPYPCCRLTHNAIDSVLQLREAWSGEVKDIRRVRVGLNNQAYQAVCTPADVRKAPKTLVQAQFSIPYTVAVALIDGHVGLRHFTEASLSRQDVLDLANIVEGYVHADIEKNWGRNVTPALVTIELKDGRVLEQRVDLPLGHPSRPIPPDVHDAKARDCFDCAYLPMRPTSAAELRSFISSLESVADIAPLVRILEPLRPAH